MKKTICISLTAIALLLVNSFPVMAGYGGYGGHGRYGEHCGYGS
jgi:1,4-alpha-glucan branching enzyme